MSRSRRRTSRGAPRPAPRSSGCAAWSSSRSGWRATSRWRRCSTRATSACWRSATSSSSSGARSARAGSSPGTSAAPSRRRAATWRPRWASSSRSPSGSRCSPPRSPCPSATTALVLALMAWSVPITSLRLPSSLLLERELRYRPVAVVEAVEAVSFYVLAVGLVRGGDGRVGRRRRGRPAGGRRHGRHGPHRAGGLGAAAVGARADPRRARLRRALPAGRRSSTSPASRAWPSAWRRSPASRCSACGRSPTASSRSRSCCSRRSSGSGSRRWRGWPRAARSRARWSTARSRSSPSAARWSSRRSWRWRRRCSRCCSGPEWDAVPPVLLWGALGLMAGTPIATVAVGLPLRGRGHAHGGPDRRRAVGGVARRRLRARRVGGARGRRPRLGGERGRRGGRLRARAAAPHGRARRRARRAAVRRRGRRRGPPGYAIASAGDASVWLAAAAGLAALALAALGLAGDEPPARCARRCGWCAPRA